MSGDTDRIHKEILVRAPVARVWRALSDSKEFGSWFGVKLTGPFRPGATMRGTITPTTADAEIAEAQRPYTGKPFEITIERMDPERVFSFRWHPYAIEPDVDYSAEPSTLVVFELHEVAEGTRVTVVESGFEGIPIARRAKAFTANEGGWGMAVQLLAKHVDRQA
ncbi:MAG TPA: SRPBCC family protein [Polyangiaceae bacterium]|jgi:uncharacterized protein YndB with AHSA1/START domain|nr:SRPBCC family protein [Polyangiaceae bacterium]